MSRSSRWAWRRAFLALVMCAASVLGACRDAPGPASGTARGETWHPLEPGLDLGSFAPPASGAPGGPPIRVLRVDPARFALRLFNASRSENGQPLTARQWCRKHDLVAAINSSMYQEDLRSSVSLMRTRGHTNNPRLSKDMTVLAFDPRSSNVPLVSLIDRECEDFEMLSEQYHTLVQSIRMVSCKGRNVWSPGDRRSVTAAIGLDRGGRVLFMHSGTPYSTHDFIDALLALPIDLDRAMYAEGGLEAQLYVGAGETEFEFVGSLGSGGIAEGYAPPIPNVVGVARLARSDPAPPAGPG